MSSTPHTCWHGIEEVYSPQVLHSLLEHLSDMIEVIDDSNYEHDFFESLDLTDTAAIHISHITTSLDWLLQNTAKLIHISDDEEKKQQQQQQPASLPILEPGTQSLPTLTLLPEDYVNDVDDDDNTEDEDANDVVVTGIIEGLHRDDPDAVPIVDMLEKEGSPSKENKNKKKRKSVEED